MPDGKVNNTEVKKEISESPKVPEELKKTTDDVTATKTQPEPEPSKRELIEKKVIDFNRGAEDEPKKEEPKPDEAKEDEPSEDEEISLEDRIKRKVSKRIGKEVAKRKTAEERVTDLESEIQALKVKRADDVKDPNKEDADPTDDQIDAEYQRALEEGNHKYAAQINRYAINKARKDGLAEADAKGKKTQEAQQQTQRRWVTLVQDHTIYTDDKRTQIDMEHPLNLNNQNSALYRTAMSFMNDKDLSRENGYDNQDKILGFRLAVNDARRELMDLSDQGKLDLTAHLKKKETVDLNKSNESKKRRKSELASTSSEVADTTTTPVPKTARGKVAEEVARRKARRVMPAVTQGATS